MIKQLVGWGYNCSHKILCNNEDLVLTIKCMLFCFHVDLLVEGDRDIPSDIRTSKVLLEIANGISGFIQLTSSNPSGFMPLLDIQVKVVDKKLIHTFYKKPVSNPILITKDSAMPFRTKKASLGRL